VGFIICGVRLWPNQGGWDGRDTGEVKVHAEFWSGNLKGDDFRDLGIGHGMGQLECIREGCVVKMWIGFSWLGIGQAAYFRKYGNIRYSSIKGGNFLTSWITVNYRINTPHYKILVLRSQLLLVLLLLLLLPPPLPLPLPLPVCKPLFDFVKLTIVNFMRLNGQNKW
jgi:hypothetical protein